jgi:hypothetical protein
MNDPETTTQSLAILRSGENFHWVILPIFALILYVYFNEISKKNWKGVAAGLALYMVHWVFEIANALIQHFSGHALWTVPSGTTFLLLVGVGIELSLMFSIAGLVMSKLLPEDPKAKILGINNRLVFAIGNAAFASFLEIFLAKTPTFVWVYPWWGALTVFIFVYIPFFLAAFYCYDWKPALQKKFIGSLLLVNVAALIIFAGILKWI